MNGRIVDLARAFELIDRMEQNLLVGKHWSSGMDWHVSDDELVLGERIARLIDHINEKEG